LSACGLDVATLATSTVEASTGTDRGARGVANGSTSPDGDAGAARQVICAEGVTRMGESGVASGLRQTSDGASALRRAATNAACSPTGRRRSRAENSRATPHLMARRSSADTARELAILVRAKGDTLGGLAARANTTPLASPPPGPRGVAPPLRRSWPRRPRNRAAARSCDRVRLSDARNARSTNLVRSSRSVVNVGDAAA
jgi:hypothetical protein